MAVIALTFGIVALAELADTSGLVTLVLATRFPARLVLLGVGAAFLVQVVVAVAAGSLAALLPERFLAAALAVIFLVSAVLLLRGDDDDDVDTEAAPVTPWRVVATCFGITLLSDHSTRYELAHGILARVEIDVPVPSRTISLVCRTDRTLTPPERAFVELIRTVRRWPV